MDRSEFVMAVRKEVELHLGALAATPAGVVVLASVQILVECLTQGPGYFVKSDASEGPGDPAAANDAEGN